MAGTYASLLNLGKLRRPAPQAPVETAVAVDSPTTPTSLYVAPTPRPAPSAEPTEPVGESPRPRDEVSPRRPDSVSKRRPLARAAFDLYEDQIQAIKRLKNKRQLEFDRDVSKSEIVREALELFFKTLT